MDTTFRRYSTLACALLLSTACARARATTESQPVAAPDETLAAEVARTPQEALAERGLVVPVEGVDASRIRDSYTAGRGGGRTHDAVDIMAPRGTPVIAADSGTIFKLRQNAAGGITIYQLDPAEQFVYYYAHLDRYRDGLAEGMPVRRGELLGFVGTTGNAPRNTPHLHFQVMLYRGRGQYWGGEPINPHPYLKTTTKR